MPGTLECSRLPHADSHTSKRHIPISSVDRNAVVCAIALVRTIGVMGCPNEQRHVRIAARQVVNRRISLFLQPECLRRCKQLSFLRPLALTLPLTEENRDGMVRAGILISLLLFEVFIHCILALHLKLRTAVDWNACTCDPARSIGCQKSDYVRDVFGLADSLKRLHAERDCCGLPRFS